ncbi:MAG TPA: cation:proton antiporter [Tepidiformaceae bacterium]|nr:cation:proton antiporter [Tepidiformaceae bacterium]
MADLPLLNTVAVSLGLAVAGGFIARWLRLSPVVGYLIVGVIISPFTPGYVAEIETVRQLAEIGVVFLMFGVGLHFSLTDLLAVRGIAIPGAILQVALSTALGAVIGTLAGLGWRAAITLGLAISVASTAVLVRSLEDRGLIQSVHARVVIGWVVVQDLATVLILALLPALDPNSSGNPAADAALSFAKAAIFLLVALVAGVRVVPIVLAIAAKTGSRELFMLSVVAIALGIALGANALGLSIALGAFIGGVVVSETEMSHEAAAATLPLQQSFAVLFFVSVGMLLDPGPIRDHFGFFTAVVATVLFGNAIISMLITGAFPYSGRTALVVGCGLAQIGEFSFVIADQATRHHLMSHATYEVVLGAAVVTIILNPLAYMSLPMIERAMRRVGPLWQWLNKQGPLPEPPRPDVGDVLIAGYGRVGELMGHAMGQLDVPFTVIDVNLDRTRRLNAAGIRATWGDAASAEVLRTAGAAHKKVIVVAVPDANTALLAVTNARRLNPLAPIIVRAQHRDELPALRQAGASEVVVPAYEGGLELMREALVALGYQSDEALQFADVSRDTVYEPGGLTA